MTSRAPAALFWALFFAGCLGLGICLGRAIVGDFSPTVAVPAFLGVAVLGRYGILRS